MGALKNDGSAYAIFGERSYAAIPKSVFAVIAYSFAQRIAGDARDRDVVMAELLREWDALHANGIIPQKPPPRLETREEEAARLEGYAATHRADGLGAANRRRIEELRHG